MLNLLVYAMGCFAPTFQRTRVEYVFSLMFYIYSDVMESSQKSGPKFLKTLEKPKLKFSVNVPAFVAAKSLL